MRKRMKMMERWWKSIERKTEAQLEISAILYQVIQKLWENMAESDRKVV